MASGQYSSTNRIALSTCRQSFGFLGNLVVMIWYLTLRKVDAHPPPAITAFFRFGQDYPVTRLCPHQQSQLFCRQQLHMFFSTPGGSKSALMRHTRCSYTTITAKYSVRTPVLQHRFNCPGKMHQRTWDTINAKRHFRSLETHGHKAEKEAPTNPGRRGNDSPKRAGRDQPTLRRSDRPGHLFRKGVDE